MLVVGVATLVAAPARAQFADVWMPERVMAGESIQGFAQWAGPASADGVMLRVPEGAVLEQVQVLRHGLEATTARVETERGGRYRIPLSDGLRRDATLAFRVRLGALAGAAAWSLTPYLEGRSAATPRVMQTEHALRGRFTIEPRRRTADNYALRLADSTATATLRPTAIPDLGTQAPFTIEFWMKSVQVSEVVVSTWTGDESDPYPVDMLVDGQGQLLVYRGQPGEHQAMTSRRPVADGQWHHIALVNNPDTRWTWLLLNGEVVDSLYNRTRLDIRHSQPLSLGRRVSVAGLTPADQIKAYTGQLDEVRLWPGARPVSLLRQMMREPVVDVPEGTIVLNFDRDTVIPRRLATAPPQKLVRERSSLAFFYPVRGLKAEIEEEMVQLEWRTDDAQTKTFVIERSTNGTDFDVIGEVVRAEGDGQRNFAYQDLQPDLKRQVLYYRVRQRFLGGSERVSGVLKIGIADAERPKHAVLIGNYPNPFNPLTTVEYQVNETVHVSLSVWDLAGQRVRELVDEEKTPGTYQVGFEALELPSGTYFVRLQLADGTQYHKMTLTK